jgi:hypothetical protein
MAKNRKPGTGQLRRDSADGLHTCNVCIYIYIIRSPPLQLLDPHHHIEMSLRILLDDVAHVIGFSSLLNVKDVFRGYIFFGT